MKRNAKLGWVLVLCLLGIGAKAQLFNEFFHVDGGFPADHGQGDQVIATKLSEQNPVREYVVAGATRYSAGEELPGVSLSKYTLDGKPVWHRSFQLNAPVPGDFTSVKGLAEVTAAKGNGYGLLAYTNSAPGQSVLIRTDAAGNLIWRVSVGRQESGSLAYDPDMNRFLVLTRTLLGGNSNLQLVVIDAGTGAIDFTRNYSGMSGSDDQPARVLYDPFRHDYLLTGTSVSRSLAETDTKLMLVRLTNCGVHVYTRTIGDRRLAVHALDAGILPDGMNSSLIIAAEVSGKMDGVVFHLQPSYTQVDIATGKVGFIRIIDRTFQIQGVVVAPGPALSIIGHEDLPFGIRSVLFNIEPTDTSQSGMMRIFNYPFSSYRFNGISNGVDGGLVMTGVHKFQQPWNGSPEFLDYLWLVTADSKGEGLCSSSEPVGVHPRFDLHSHSSQAERREFASTPILVVAYGGDESGLSACDVPFRLAKTDIKSEAGFLVFPNPASSVFQIQAELADKDKVEVILSDLRGRQLSSQVMSPAEHPATVSVSVSNLPDGVYLIDLHVNGQSLRREKIIVRH